MRTDDRRGVEEGRWKLEPEETPAGRTAGDTADLVGALHDEEFELDGDRHRDPTIRFNARNTAGGASWMGRPPTTVLKVVRVAWVMQRHENGSVLL